MTKEGRRTTKGLCSSFAVRHSSLSWACASLFDRYSIQEVAMFHLLRSWFVLWLSALRRVAELHPGVFSVSACSPPIHSPEEGQDERRD
jgi:hypothetical protein